MTPHKPLPPPVVDQLRGCMNGLNFWCYLSELQMLSDAGPVVHLGSPHQFIIDRLQEYFMPLLQGSVGAFYGGRVELHLDPTLPCNCDDPELVAENI